MRLSKTEWFFVAMSLVGIVWLVLLAWRAQ